VDKSNALDFDEFCKLYQKLKFRPEIYELYTSLLKTEWSLLSKDAMKTFLENTQKETYSDEEVSLLSIFPPR